MKKVDSDVLMGVVGVVSDVNGMVVGVVWVGRCCGCCNCCNLFQTVRNLYLPKAENVGAEQVQC